MYEGQALSLFSLSAQKTLKKHDLKLLNLDESGLMRYNSRSFGL